MGNKLSILVLTAGPALVSVLFLGAWVEDLSTTHWLGLEPEFKFLFSVLIPAAGGFILGWNERKAALVFAPLLYGPCALASSVLFAFAQSILDPVPRGAAMFALAVWFYSLLPMVIIGLAVALIAGGIAIAVRSIRQ